MVDAATDTSNDALNCVAQRLLARLELPAVRSPFRSESRRIEWASLALGLALEMSMNFRRRLSRVGTA
jgi:hypothetical protein